MNIQRGFIVGFNCCLEGRWLKKNSDGTFTNADEVNIGKKSWHPFLIISNTNKNNSSFTNYFSAIPISSSNSKFNQEHGISLTKDMFSSKGDSLVYNNSIIKFDSIVSLHKKDYNQEMQIIAEISPDTKPYKQILSKVMKNFGCNEII